MEYRIKVARSFILAGYPVNKVLKYSKVHKTAWYRCQNKSQLKTTNTRGRPVPGYSFNIFGEKVSDDRILLALSKIRSEEYTTISGGYKKLSKYLKIKYGYIVNHKKVYRMCRENNFLLAKKFKKKSPRLISKNRKVTSPHQVWQFDIKYGYIHGENRFFYILAYLDVFSRYVVHYHIGVECKAKNLIGSFSTALRKSKIGFEDHLVIRSDNGPQMTSKQFYKHLSKLNKKIEHEFIPCGTPNKNAHIESFYSIIESEFIPLYYFKSFKDVYLRFYRFINFYNTERVHSSLNYKTPLEIIQRYEQGGDCSFVKKTKI